MTESKGLIKRVTDRIERSLEEQNTWCHCKTPTQHAKITETLDRTVVDVYCLRCYKPIYGVQFNGQIDRSELPKIEKRLVDIREFDTSKEVLHIIHATHDVETMPLCFTANYNPSTHTLATIYDVLLQEERFIHDSVQTYIVLEDGMYTYERSETGGKWIKIILNRKVKVTARGIVE
ncbi:hypothetical protein [Bacillus toyonensis]|uniref:hypothetical protein n=1 Tax=Bacillus toyonensis TaxID=155322 RepID=UPI000BF70C90|nr:hypothetical protein [Bacillus toyonensis]PGF05041.1 hypothetical protein COM61_00985 [Bacillus toyonensis]